MGLWSSFLHIPLVAYHEMLEILTTPVYADYSSSFNDENGAREGTEREGVREYDNGRSIDGAADHDTHEAIYLHDPDFNSIELVWDRDPSYWRPMSPEDDAIHEWAVERRQPAGRA
jgi:hypothetical protein